MDKSTKKIENFTFFVCFVPPRTVVWSYEGMFISCKKDAEDVCKYKYITMSEYSTLH